MKFKLKRNEIILVSVLGLLIYVFVFYKFIWTPVIPEIGEQKNLITTLEKEKQQLDLDLSNLDSKKIELVSKKAGYERLEGYLNNEANVTDCIEYIDKLANVVDSNITKVNIAIPEQKEVDKSKYYQIKIDFNTVLPINKIKDMLIYIENSSKLVDVSRFVLSPAKVENLDTTSLDSSILADKLFNAALTLNMYTLNIEAMDKIYEYSRHRFNRYEYGSITAFEDNTLDIDSTLADNIDTDGSNVIVNNKDFEIKLFSFLAAGDNFVLLGSDKLNEKLTLKTNKYITMDLSIGNNSYTLNAVNGSGKPYKIQGSIPNRDLNMFINVDISQIKENENMGVKIKVINNSDNKLNVTLADKSRKVTLTDRTGKVISSGNDKENVYIK